MNRNRLRLRVIMLNYDDLLIQHKDSLQVEFIHAIDDSTLIQSYSIYTNLHVDYGITEKRYNHWSGTKKSEFNKLTAKFKKLTGRKVKLYRTDNSLGYTRLIYKLY